MKKHEIESYVSCASVASEHKERGLSAVVSAYKIELRFLGGLTATQKEASIKAADRWTKVIIGDVPSCDVGGEIVDDLLIEIQGIQIDGRGRILGQAGPTKLRPLSAGTSAWLPAKGIIQMDMADLAEMEANGSLLDVITHEMGHILGIGRQIWTLKGLVQGVGTNNPIFTGANAKREYGVLRGTVPTPVPVENTGDPMGTRDTHWRESMFKNELMTGWIGSRGNPISRMTIASLQDIGYVVNMSAAEQYSLPDLRAIAEEGVMLSAVEGKYVLPIFAPKILPDDSLIA